MSISQYPERLLKALSRAQHLAEILARRPSGERDLDLARRYNLLRSEVKALAGDRGFDELVPALWWFPPALWSIVPAVVVPIFAAAYAFSRDPSGVKGDFLPTFLAIMFVGWMLFFAVATYWLKDNHWFSAPTSKTLTDRTSFLVQYIADLIRYHPRYSKMLTIKDPDNHVPELVSARTTIDNLEEELMTTRHELDQLRNLWTGLETPYGFQVQDDTLALLSPLERQRLLEAVQAFRVGAWTPAAAVCGMLLEGRLQAICRRRGIPLGGMRQMIEHLGEEGLLSGYHGKLAEISGFFRNRSAHPTTEEFDREKTTLILTSLIILLTKIS
jgi:hypothetical protein